MSICIYVRSFHFTATIDTITILIWQNQKLSLRVTCLKSKDLMWQNPFLSDSKANDLSDCIIIDKGTAPKVCLQCVQNTRLWTIMQALHDAVVLYFHDTLLDENKVAALYVWHKYIYTFVFIRNMYMKYTRYEIHFYYTLKNLGASTPKCEP